MGDTEFALWTDQKRFLVSPEYVNHVKILNTGNVPLRYKARTINGGSEWEYILEWANLNAWASKEFPVFGASDVSREFIVDTLGVAFDKNGLELGFRPNSSIIGITFGGSNGNVGSIVYGFDKF